MSSAFKLEFNTMSVKTVYKIYYKDVSHDCWGRYEECGPYEYDNDIYEDIEDAQKTIIKLKNLPKNCHKKFLIYAQTFVYDSRNTDGITEKLLQDAGFKRVDTVKERNYMNEKLNVDDYSVWQLWINDTYKIDITKRLTNNNAQWNIHVDNADCSTIGTVDIDTVKQFNDFMQILSIDYKL